MEETTGETVRRFVALWSLLMLIGCAGPCAAQSPPLDPGAADFHPATPTVWFERVWPEALQQKFVIAVDATGQGVYWSSTRSEPVQATSTGGGGKKRKTVAVSEPENPAGIELKREFTLSPASVKLVFASAERLRFFDGDFEYKKKIAFTGAKTLTYADTTRHFRTSYNASMDHDVEALTQLFNGISATIEFGERLQFKYRYDKLGLLPEMNAMAEASQNGWLAEVQIVAPLLKSLAHDGSVLHLVRLHAAEILARAGIPQ